MTVTNCHSNDPTIAALEVVATQRLNQRSEDDKTYHFLFSFRECEYPSPEVLRDCEAEFCRALGFAEHQRVSVVHRDTNNLHVHVAVNKIHPTRLTVKTPFNDFWQRSVTAKRLEIKHNLHRDRHDRREEATSPSDGAADMEHHAGIESFTRWLQLEIAEDLTRATSWAELHRAARAHGVNIRLRGSGCVIFNGEKVVRASSIRRDFSLSALVKRLGPFQAAQIDSPAVAYEPLLAKPEPRPRVDGVYSQAPPPHARGRSEHLSAIVDQRAAALENAANRIRSVRLRSIAAVPTRWATVEELQERSQAWTRLIAELSQAARFGRQRQTAAARSASARPHGNYSFLPISRDSETGELYNSFVRERAAREALRSDRGAQLRRAQKVEIERVLQRWRLRRTALRLVKGTRGEKRFMHAAARLAMRQELRTLRARAAEDRRALLHASKRLVWADWLQARARLGDVGALNQLRRRRVSTHQDSLDGAQRAIAGEPLSARAQWPQGAVDHVTKTGVVIYRGALTGVRDDGHQLRVRGDVSHAVLAEALRVAANRYGVALRISGDSAFKQAVVEVAAARNIQVTFDDATLEARRKAHQQTEKDDGRRYQPGSEPRRTQLRTQPGQTSSQTAPDGAATRRQDGLRDVRLRELVRHREWSERILPGHVPADVASGARQGREAVRRAAGAARELTGGAPPFRRGRLRALSTLGSAPGQTRAAKQRPLISLAGRTKGNGGAPPILVAPRVAIPAMELLARPAVEAHGNKPEAAVARYIAEREAKRARGIADIDAHQPFDGRPGEFTFVGRRNIDGHVLFLLRDSTKIIVLPAQEPYVSLRNGDRIALDNEGRITSHRSQGRRR